MRYAVNVPNFAEYADPRTAAALAAEAEAAGWDGFFVWDHMVFDRRLRLPVADPWVLLAAVALATERLRLGPMVTPLARRRPWKVARETVTLDHLSGGRLLLGVGLGTPAADEYGAFGEPTGRRERAAMLDEALEVLILLWSGGTVSSHGRHYRLEEIAFLPAPVQRPRIPILVAGTWPAGAAAGARPPGPAAPLTCRGSAPRCRVRSTFAPALEGTGGVRPGRFRYPSAQPGAFPRPKHGPLRRSVGANE
jgi:alkanesulfonate monooxygenase SsuD/methylene tetrahydromethanopterin reductase-like flavin-dependent oxidoreductase (luciferase family)